MNRHRQVIFCCSPKCSPLPNALPEAEEIKRLCPESCPSSIVPGTTADDLRCVLSDTTSLPTARFLFCGHADATIADANGAPHNTLGFVNVQGGIDAVQAETLVDMLSAHSPSRDGELELVFLNGCNSHELGKAVHEAGIPHVVCWKTKCDDRAARIFSNAFYTYLHAHSSTGEMYAQAFEEAKIAVRTHTSVRPADGDGWTKQTFELTDPAARERTASGATAAGIPVLFSSPTKRSSEQGKGGTDSKKRIASVSGEGGHADGPRVKKIQKVESPSAQSGAASRGARASSSVGYSGDGRGSSSGEGRSSGDGSSSGWSAGPDPVLARFGPVLARFGPILARFWPDLARSPRLDLLGPIRGICSLCYDLGLEQ
jgi:hypothetical protein